jgi:hypothetical protein
VADPGEQRTSGVEGIEHIMGVTGARRHAVEREFVANGLYLGIVLYVALAVIPTDDLPSDTECVVLILGTGAGLILAHWFSFHVAASALSPEGRTRDHETEEAGAQVAGGVTVAVFGAIPFLFFDGELAVNVTQFLLGLLPALAGYAIGRRRGHSRLLSTAVAAGVLAIASVITLLKVLVAH